jgi:hypothetical protein
VLPEKRQEFVDIDASLPQARALTEHVVERLGVARVHHAHEPLGAAERCRSSQESWIGQYQRDERCADTEEPKRDLNTLHGTSGQKIAGRRQSTLPAIGVWTSSARECEAMWVEDLAWDEFRGRFT